VKQVPRAIEARANFATDAIGRLMVPDYEAITAVRELALLCADQHETLRRIAEGDRPTDAPTWHSGRSWRIELARVTLARFSELESA
jgi:hypothetical protein